MSAQQFFNEVDAVVQVLSEYVQACEPDVHLENDVDVGRIVPDEDQFTAIWQAVELLSRAHAVLLPLAQFEGSKAALNIPDPRPKEGPKLIVPGR